MNNYGHITKCNFKILPIGKYIENRTDLIVIENKNPKYKDSVILLKSPLEEKSSIPRFSIIIDFDLQNIEFIDLDDTTLYQAGLQDRIRFNLLNFKEQINKIIEIYNNYKK